MSAIMRTVLHVILYVCMTVEYKKEYTIVECSPYNLTECSDSLWNEPLYLIYSIL